MSPTAPSLVRIASPWRTWLEVRGPSRVRFLQGLCSNDVEKLKVGRACEAYFPTVQGKVLAHTLLLKQEDAVLVAGLGNQADALLPHLQKYGMIEDVEINDRRVDSAGFLVWGEGCEAWISENLGPASALDRLAHANLVWDDLDLLVFHTPLFDRPSWELRVAEDRFGELAERMGIAGIPEASSGELDRLRIVHGFPLHGVDISADHLAQEVNRDAEAISFRKGCYLGQETVARIDALGHVNKKLVKVRLGADWQGTQIPQVVTAAGKEIGQITSRCESEGISLGLAMLRRGHNQAGEPITTDSGTLHVL